MCSLFKRVTTCKYYMYSLVVNTSRMCSHALLAVLYVHICMNDRNKIAMYVYYTVCPPCLQSQQLISYLKTLYLHPITTCTLFTFSIIIILQISAFSLAMVSYSDYTLFTLPCTLHVYSCVHNLIVLCTFPSKSIDLACLSAIVCA